MNFCPDCQSVLIDYYSANYYESICWNCGYYKSNSPAFLHNPELFKNMIRDDPQYFIQKYLNHDITLSDDSYHEPHNRRKVNRTLFSTRSLTCQSTHLLLQSFQTNPNSAQSSELIDDSTCELSCPALGSRSHRRCRIQLQA